MSVPFWIIFTFQGSSDRWILVGRLWIPRAYHPEFSQFSVDFSMPFYYISLYTIFYHFSTHIASEYLATFYFKAKLTDYLFLYAGINLVINHFWETVCKFVICFPNYALFAKYDNTMRHVREMSVYNRLEKTFFAKQKKKRLA